MSAPCNEFWFPKSHQGSQSIELIFVVINILLIFLSCYFCCSSSFYLVSGNGNENENGISVIWEVSLYFLYFFFVIVLLLKLNVFSDILFLNFIVWNVVFRAFRLYYTSVILCQSLCIWHEIYVVSVFKSHLHILNT